MGPETVGGSVWIWWRSFHWRRRVLMGDLGVGTISVRRSIWRNTAEGHGRGRSRAKPEPLMATMGGPCHTPRWVMRMIRFETIVATPLWGSARRRRSRVRGCCRHPPGAPTKGRQTDSRQDAHRSETGIEFCMSYSSDFTLKGCTARLSPSATIVLPPTLEVGSNEGRRDVAALTSGVCRHLDGGRRPTGLSLAASDGPLRGPCRRAWVYEGRRP